MRIYLKFFGCKINQYETEILRESLESYGNVSVDELKIAEILIIMSCAVTETSVKKLRKFVSGVKFRNRKIIIIIAGCAVNYLKKIDETLTETYCFTNEEKYKIPEFIAGLSNKEPLKNKINSGITKFDNHSRGLIKIQDGCDNYCSYCVIPYLRKDLISRNRIEIAEEFKTLLKNGYQEIILTGINISKYKYNNYMLDDLLAELVELPGNFRIRLSSINIDGITDRLIDIMKNSGKICSHLHISLQSGSNEILKLMNRNYTAEYYFDKVQKLKNSIQDIGITTDIITGFPGETEKKFKETINFIKKIEFSRTHIFPYSDRKITSSYNLPEKQSEKIKYERCAELKKIGNQFQEKFVKDRIGKMYSVIPEYVSSSRDNSDYFNNSENISYGYTENYIRGKIIGLQKNSYAGFLKVKILSFDKKNCIADFEIC
ncbi:tRNA (N(6)-L-threonylcarbamoyladenosine(37)-C(2))-methylthiotransferase MtaB [Candidatus Dependentiae bacterium]|nr:tRNA (N(6)-L-threonylcarbamoyladenosine(37)-C(2))-methylthiotransferase MtaB [Candidatus Dependentiae bacterium]